MGYDNINIELIQDRNYTETAQNSVGQTGTSGFRTISFTSGVYCSSSGSDTTGSGTVGSPYRTISRCNDDIASGLATQIGILSSTIFDEIVDLNSGCTLVAAASGITPRLQSIGNEISDSRIETLSAINRRVYAYCPLLDAIVVACEDSGNIDTIYASLDGDTWINLFQNVGVNYLCTAVDCTTGVLFGDDTGNIERFSTTGGGRNRPYIESSGIIKGLTFFNSVAYGVTISSASANKLVKSTDLTDNTGTGFTDVSTSSGFDGVTVGSETVQTISTYDNKLIVAWEKIIAWSNDGTGFSDTNSYVFTNTEVTITKMFEYNGFLYFATGAGGLWRVRELGQTPTRVLTGNIEQIEANNNLYVVTTGGDLYRSIDGVNFSLLKTGIDPYLGIFDTIIYAGDTRLNLYFFKCNGNVEFNNLYFDTNYLDYAIFGNDNDITVKYCDFDGFFSYPIDLADDLTIENSIVRNCEEGVFCGGDLIAQNNVFYNIQDKAIELEGANLTVIHNTFYNCNYFLYISNAITDDDIKDNIFNFAWTYAIYSETTIVSINTSLYSRSLFYKTNIFTSLNLSPLFRSTTAGIENLKLKTRAGGFFFPTSPAQEVASDDKDLGAYDFSYSDTAKTAITIELTGVSSEFTIIDNRTKFSNERAISGNPKIYFRNIMRDFVFAFNSETYVTKEFVQNVNFLHNIHGAFYLKPESVTGYTDNTGSGVITNTTISTYPKAMLYLDINNPDYTINTIVDSSKSWAVGQWRGWSVSINSKYYRILYNDTNALIIDTEDDELTDDIYSIDRLKCRLSAQTIQKNPIFYDGFKYDYPYNSFQLIFSEVIE